MVTGPPRKFSGQQKSLRLGYVYRDTARGELAEFTDRLAVHIHLVGVIDIVRQLDREPGLAIAARWFSAVPGIAGVSLVAARRPSGQITAAAEDWIERSRRRGQVHRGPAGIVEVRLRPGHVVASAKLPWTVQLRGGVAQRDLRLGVRVRLE